MPGTEGKKSKYIFLFLRIAVVAVGIIWAIIWLRQEQRWSKLSEIFHRVNVGIFIASLAIYIISQLIFVSRWYLLLWVQSIKIGFWPAVKLHFLGLFYNNCLPSAVGGDLLRAWYVTRHTDKKLEAALSVLVDRVVGVIGIVVMALVFCWFIPVEGLKEQFKSQNAGTSLSQRIFEHRWAVSVTVAVFLIVMAAFISNAKGRDLLRRGCRTLCEYGTAAIGKVRKAISIYYNRKLALCFALLLTFACQGVFIIGLWLIGRDMGVTAGIKYYLIFFPVSWLLGTLPVSIGGAVVVESGLVLMFTRVAGVRAEEALALALCQRLLWLSGSLPGAVIHLSGAHLPKDFSVDCKEGIN